MPRADLILPNYTEAQLLLQQQPVTDELDDTAAQALADALQPLASNAVVTGLPLGKYIGCAGTGADRFVIKKLHISRSFPGTGDLYGAVLIGSLLQGNALSAAADNAAEFVSLAIQARPTRRTPASACGLSRCCPACAPCGRNRRAFYDGQADFEYRAGRAPHPPEHRQRGAHLCLHGCRLHLVGPMGFAIDDKKAQARGLDYWHYLDITYYDSLADFFARNNGPYYYFTTRHPSATPMYSTRTGLIWCRARGRRAAEALLVENQEHCIRCPCGTPAAV